MSPPAPSRKRARAEEEEAQAAPQDASSSPAPNGASRPEEQGAADPSDQHEPNYRKQQEAAAAEGQQQQQQGPTKTPPSAAPDAGADDSDPFPPAETEPSETIDALLERTMREIVASRAYPATACPSEVPRRLEALHQRRPRQAGALPPWRELMEPTREVARRLAREGVLDITQRGRVVEDLAGPIRGPIRLRARPTEAGD